MPSAVRVRLICKNQRTGSVVEYTHDLPITIGRSAEFNTVVIEDRIISRQHARLELEGHHLVISDLNSANGTYVNQKRIQRLALKAGDLIRIGPYQFSWSYLEQGMDATVLFTPTAEIRSVERFQQPTSVPQEMTAASKVMEAAEAYNREQGHEIDGFLSSE